MEAKLVRMSGKLTCQGFAKGTNFSLAQQTYFSAHSFPVLASFVPWLYFSGSQVSEGQGRGTCLICELDESDRNRDDFWTFRDMIY